MARLLAGLLSMMGLSSLGGRHSKKKKPELFNEAHQCLNRPLSHQHCWIRCVPPTRNLPYSRKMDRRIASHQKQLSRNIKDRKCSYATNDNIRMCACRNVSWYGQLLHSLKIVLFACLVTRPAIFINRRRSSCAR